MRIITGRFKRHRLKCPPHPDRGGPTRPITDRVKEALFSRLDAAGLLGGGNVLDVFAGTGGLGLEALSRGAEHCTFVEQHRQVQRILEQNIAILDLGEETTVLGVDAMAGNWAHLLPRVPWRIAFLDPPYALSADPESPPRFAALFETLATTAEPGAGLSLRMQSDGAPPPPTCPSWLGPKSVRYGTMTLHLYQKPDDEAS